MATTWQHGDSQLPNRSSATEQLYEVESKHFS
jgi:hypothetical protein